MTNNGCKRYCDVMNRPAYIVLFKGDDSNFEGNQSVDIVIDTELDTTGMKAHFRFMDFVQNFDSIPENKTLSLVFPNAKTSEFPLGAADATLRFEDASGKFRTVSNRIHIVVTNSVNEAYDNEDSQSITVTVKGTVTWEMIQGKPTFATVATSGSYNDLTDRPTIPAPITIDPALSPTSENPVQNKVVTNALYTGFTEWVCDEISEGWEFVSCVFDTSSDPIWIVTVKDEHGPFYLSGGSDAYAVTIQTSKTAPPNVRLSRHLITPTKTSQLTNDGPSSGPNVGHPFATTNQIPAPVDISGKLDGAAAYPAWMAGTEYPEDSVVSHRGLLWIADVELPNTEPGTPEGDADWHSNNVTIDNLKQDALSSAQLAAVNSGATAAKVETWDGYAAQIAAKASLTDLPYALVTISTPTVWLFSGSGVQSGHVYSVVETEMEGYWTYSLKDNGSQISYTDAGEQLTTIDFSDSGIPQIDITATLACYALFDRANNLIDATTGNVTLTLPPFEAGKVRDLLVACTIGLDANDEPWSVIFQGADGEAISFKAEGDDASTATFPVPDAAGDWWYSLTERAPHVFAVSLKQLQNVSQTQGGA